MVQHSAVSIRQLRDWASRSHVVEASFAVRESARLGDLCQGTEASEQFDARWSFETGLEGFPIVTLWARGALRLTCQRCLRPVTWPLEVNSRLTVVGSEKEIRDVSSPYDTVVAGPEGFVLGTILEDEILTSLPMAPAHDDCPVTREAKAQSSPDASRPLAGLAALMRQGRE